MSEYNATLIINEEIKSANDLELKYKKIIDRVSKFGTEYIGDKIIRNYYRFCIEDDLSVEEFIEMFQINETKQSFIERATKVINDSKNNYLKFIEENLDLTLCMNYKSYTRESIKDIYAAIYLMQNKFNKKLDIVFNSLENGFSKSDLENLVYLSGLMDQELMIYDNSADAQCKVTLTQVIEAYVEMNKLVDRINASDLSPFEKFLLIHDYAADKIYKTAENDETLNGAKCRSFINVMTSDSIVCVGYAQIMKEFCKRVGIECEYISGNPLSENNREGFTTNMEEGHAANIVHIVDDKYGINGYYFCDACWDSRQNHNLNKKYFYSALPIQDVDKIQQSKYFGDTISSMNIPKISNPISVNTYRMALNTIYSNREQVESDLQYTIKFAHSACKTNSDNDFTREYFRQNNFTN